MTRNSNGRLYRWLLGLSLAALCGLLIPARASADSFTTFSISGTFQDGDSFASGSTVTIDTTTGLSTASSISILGLPDTFSSTPNLVNSASDYTWIGSTFDGLDLSSGYPPGFVGFTGGSVVSLIAGLNVPGFVSGATASLTPEIPDPPDPPAAPEPSAFLLLGMGLAGLLAGSKLLRQPLPA